MSNAQAQTVERPAVDAKIPWLYLLFTLSQMIGNNLVGQFMNFYVTERLLISAVQFAGFLSLARIMDLLAAVVSGGIVQRTQMRWGQYRSWILICPVIISVSNFFIFINFPFSIMVKGLIVAFAYFGEGAGIQYSQGGYNGLMAKIAGPNMSVRTAISAKVVQGSNIGRILTALITIPLVMFFDAKPGIDGYTVTNTIFVSIAIIGCLQLFFHTKKYDPYDPNFKPGGGTNIFSALLNTLKNPQMIVLMAGDLCRFMISMGIAPMAAYFFRFSAKNLSYMTPYLFAFAIVGLIGSMIGRPIALKLGKKNAGTVSGLILTASYFGLLFVGTNPWLYIACLSLGSFGNMIVSAVAIPMYLDCAEYKLYSTGIDNRTYSMTMWGTAAKVGFFISTFIAPFVLGLSGYNAGVMEKSDLFARYVGMVFCSIAALYTIIITFFYKITEEKSKEYAEENHKRAQERAQGANS